MSTRKSIQKVNTTESPTKTTITMSLATTVASLSQTTSKTQQIEIDSKITNSTDKSVASDDETTTTSTPTETTAPATSIPTITTTTILNSTPKTVSTAENDLIKTCDSENLDTTTSSSSSIKEQQQQQLSPTNNTDLTITTIEIKRGRRKNSAASSITSSPTCSQQSNNKKSSVGSDDNNDEIVDAGANENVNDLTQNSIIDQKINDDTKSESPVRVGRKKKVFNKTAIITRKSAATTPTSKPTIINQQIRTSMRNRRNSTGKIDLKQNEPTKKNVKQTRKTLSSTPEPRTPIKRKREDSSKSDDKDEQQPIDKIIKIETEDEQQQQEQMEINDELDEDENTNEKLNIKKEILNDEKDSITGSDKIVEDESTKLDDSSLDIKSELKSNDDTNNDNKTLTFPRRRGRPKLQKTDKTVDNIRRRRSDKIPIDTPLELPETKRPKRRGRKTDGKDDNNSVLDETIKTDLETTVDDAADDDTDLLTATTTNINCSKNLNGLAKPLTVDTTNVTTTLPTEIDKTKLLDTIKNEEATTSCSDKAASLSPELISEGVSAISVKQFYKKPEFLENNLGIEKDPKLGEIVQEVEKNSTTPTNILSTNNKKIINEIENKNDNESNIIDEIDFIAEGELHIDEESIADDSNKKLDTNEINQNDDDIKNENNIKDSNKENKSSDMLKLNLCDNINKNQINKNNNDENSSTAVQIESINKNIINNNDNNVKDNIQSECNNKKPADEIKIVKDLIKIDNCNDNKKILKTNSENLKVTEINENLDNDENQIKRDEINSENNIIKIVNEHSKNASNLIENCKNVLEEDSKMNVAKDVNLTNKENCSKNIEEDIIMKEEENEEISKDKSEKVTLKFTLESKSKESDEELSSNHSKSETIDEDNSKISSEQNKKLLTSINKRLLETPETMRQKEKHLKNLGLLTHKAAVQANIEKQRRRKILQNTASANKNKQQIAEPSSSTNITSTVAVANSSSNNAGNLNKILDSDSIINNSTVYSIKSGENKRKSTSGNGSNNNNSSGRQSLKITFQKGRGRGIQNERSGSQSNQSCEDTYYTIQNENEVGQPEEAVSHGRKSLNRNHTIDSTVSNQSDTTADSQNKKDGKEKILIPEKASSFSIHPGRLCQDQCYYCGGRFGLYDTPCHVAQLKSIERQQKILANEEKLTVDNCLCDACFRHVDKRANVPSYKKRLSGLNSVDNENLGNNSQQNDNEHTDEQLQQGQHQHSFGNKSICFVPGCNNSAAHSLRKKCVRKTIKKILPNFDMSSMGGITPICSHHYDSILQYLGCALCKRRLGKNHMYHIQESEKLEALLSENNVPVQIGNSSAICKLCRYFTNLLSKPSTGTKQNDFVCNYRRRLLQFHNVQTDDDASDDGIDSEKSKSKRNRKTKREQTIPTTILDEKTSESTNSPPSLIIDENPSDLSNSGLTSTPATATSGQMMLDNDVLVDYDVPVISSESPTPSPPPLLASKLKSILQSNNNISNDKNIDIAINNNKKEDISLVLRSNPNISMRELFPGEEEMGMHVNLPFGSSSSHRTPEGWTRVQTFLQYDEPTRRLWEDLQKPYGNQSSFLRHLILLEKYYRNGDLILSHNASSNASVYSETVQNRLRSYDNHNLINNNNNHIASNSTITVTPIINNMSGSQQQSGNRKSLSNKNERSRSQSIESLKQINNSNNNNNNNYPITITTRPKQQNTQSSTSTSTSSNNNNNNNNSNNNKNQSSTSNNNSSNDLIKSNLLFGNKNAIEILPILSSLSATKATIDNNSIQYVNSMTKQQKLLAAANKLIGNETAIDLKTTTTTTNKNPINDQKKSDNIHLSMPPELISINRPLSNMLMNNKQQNQQLLQQQQLQLQQQHQRIQNFQQQQQQLPQQQHHHNKHHNPSTSKHGIIVLPETLSPMEQINIKNWRPTLMPITSGAHLNQSGPLYKTVDGRKLPGVVQVQSRGRPYLISIHDYNRMCILRREKLLYDQMVKNGKIKHGMRPPAVLSPKILSSHQQQQQQQNKLKIPTKVLEQNSLIPVGGGQRSTTTTNTLQQMSQEQSRQHHIKQKQYIQQQQQQQISLLKSSTAGGNFVPILPKLPHNHQLQILPTSSNHTPMSISTSLVNNSVSIVPTISGVLSLAQGATLTGNNMATLTPSTITSGLNSVRNIIGVAQKPRLDQFINNNRKHLFGNTSTATSLLDNSLLSKIPKSLTVIPQQKSQSQQQGRTSAEDLTSA